MPGPDRKVSIQPRWPQKHAAPGRSSSSGHGSGCGPTPTSAIASSSLVTEWVKGKTLAQAETIRNTQIAEELALPPVKIHCSILAEDAIKAAIEDYRKKHGAGAPAEAAAKAKAA